MAACVRCGFVFPIGILCGRCEKLWKEFKRKMYEKFIHLDDEEL